MTTKGDRLVAKLWGAATAGGDLTADEMHIFLRGRLPEDDTDVDDRELPPERLAQLFLPRVAKE